MAELREAVDFLRYYAEQAEVQPLAAPRGPFAAISPWNFPLAIFTGQIAAAPVVGNPVLAKPAPQTPLIAHRAIQLMHEAGIPRDAIQLLPGAGEVGTALTSDARIAGVAFTGSLPTARRIDRAMAANLAPDAPLIAETGGLNAMIVDSTALPEQAVRDVLASAFQSAGQRCSALRILYVREDVADRTIRNAHRRHGRTHPGQSTGPRQRYRPRHRRSRPHKDRKPCRRLHQGRQVDSSLEGAGAGHLRSPTVLRVTGIADIPEEIFGPVLHVATFKADEIDAVIAAINGSGYGLTFGMHTRISSRVRAVSAQVHAGNIYINRNQIGAVVGSQPFGGEGLSGTGPKAGGPHYLPRFTLGYAHPQTAALPLPGPTGESNTLTVAPAARCSASALPKPTTPPSARWPKPVAASPYRPT
ncbi:aldehyde dehydrogenase family protein [Devosia sp. A8/3-2]|nr:aldehyde dehydrogenase family protein [Devosia sp. A8/3-2]